MHERFPIFEINARKKNKTLYIPVKSILKGHIPNILINDIHLLNSSLKSCNGFGNRPKLKSYRMKPDFDHFYIDHFYFKSLEEFVKKLNRGSAKTSDDIKIKLVKIKRFFKMNRMNKFKFDYIKKMAHINISPYFINSNLSYY